MIRLVAIIALALSATACESDTSLPPQETVNDRPTTRDPSDTCSAKALQYLVGRPKTEIPVPVDVKSRRVACTTCPVTMDFSPQRLNIFFDQATGIVREVKCG